MRTRILGAHVYIRSTKTTNPTKAYNHTRRVLNAGFFLGASEQSSRRCSGATRTKPSTKLTKPHYPHSLLNLTTLTYLSPHNHVVTPKSDDTRHLLITFFFLLSITFMRSTFQYASKYPPPPKKGGGSIRYSIRTLLTVNLV